MLTCLSVLILVNTTALASDWPCFMGPSGDGTSSETGIGKDWKLHPPKKIWETKMNDDGYAGAAIADGKVFIVDHKDSKDVVRALDFATGNDVWEYPYADAAKPSYGFARSTPAISEGRVYTLSLKGRVHCLDAKKGKKVWERNICRDFAEGKETKEYTPSPFIDGNRLILVPGGKTAGVVALDKATGETIWQNGSDDPGCATPMRATLNGKPQYIVFSANQLAGLDVDTGAILWSVPWITQYGINAAQPIVIGDRIFITSSYGVGCALVEVTRTGANFAWKNKEMMAIFSSPLYRGGYVYGVTDPTREMMCMDPASGAVKWRQKGLMRGAAVFLDGVILDLDGERGELVMIRPNPERYEEIGRAKLLSGPCYTPPAVSDGKIVVRNKKKIACFALTATR
jgi:outer membrane protein assembly factor BamB